MKTGITGYEVGAGCIGCLMMLVPVAFYGTVFTLVVLGVRWLWLNT